MHMLFSHRGCPDTTKQSDPDPIHMVGFIPIVRFIVYLLVAT